MALAGAALAVYLTLAGQRKEDRARIRSALVREVIEFSRLVAGHLDTCENIRAGAIALPVPRLVQAMQMPSPIIYPAVADKIGLLSSPQNVVAFYARIVEVTMIMVPAISDDPKLQHSILQTHNIRVLAEAWLDILQFARGIIDHSYHDEDFDRAVRARILTDIQAQITSTRQKFRIVD